MRDLAIVNKLRELADDMFGVSILEVGRYFLYKDCPVKIVSGQYWGSRGISNFWEWKRVLGDGKLSEEIEHGYDDGDDFRSIKKSEVIKYAKAADIAARLLKIKSLAKRVPAKYVRPESVEKDLITVRARKRRREILFRKFK